MIIEIINNLRRTVRALRPEEKMVVHFEKVDTSQRLILDHAMALCRIGQAAINNA